MDLNEPVNRRPRLPALPVTLPGFTRSPWFQVTAVILLVAVHLSLLLATARDKSATMDESFHIARGVSAIFSGDFRLSVSHPPLINVISTLPLLALPGLQVPLRDPVWHNPTALESLRKRRFAEALLWARDKPYWRGNPNPLQIIFLARLPIMLLSAALGLLVYWWSRQLWGPEAGLAGLGLYVFSPTVLAHGCLSTTDTGAALTIFLFAFVLHRHLVRPRRWTLALCGLTLGLALLAKFTAILLLPLLGLSLLLSQAGSPRQKLAGFFSWRGPSGLTGATAGAAMVLAAAFIVWAGYGFEAHSIYRIDALPPTAGGLSMLLKRTVVNFLAAVPLVPRTYYFGLSRTLMETQIHIYPVFFAGRTSAEGFWYYYPALFAMKEPLALLALLGISLVAVRKAPPVPRPAGVVMGVFAVGIALAFMFLNRKDVGLRYLLPVYPFLFVWLARLVTVKLPRLAAPAVVWALVLIYAANGIAACPDYLVHFNSLVGGPDGGLRYSIEGEDWDQDLPALADFCRRQGIGDVRVKIRGNVDPAAYGIPAREWKCGPGEKGWYAVSLAELRLFPQDLGECLPVISKMSPAAVLNHTIYVYHLESARSPTVGAWHRR